MKKLKSMTEYFTNNENGKNQITSLLDGLIWLAAAYLIASFTALSFDMGVWNWSIRLIFAVFVLVVELAILKKYLLKRTMIRSAQDNG